MIHKYGNIISITEQLMSSNAYAMEMFEKYAKQKETAPFDKTVKPFVDEVKRLSDEWIVMATDYVIWKQPKYLQKKLLEDTFENLQIQSVACFQADTKKKRFYERNKSIDYVLKGLLTALKQ